MGNICQNQVNYVMILTKSTSELSSYILSSSVFGENHVEE